ncbi:2-oxo acid dehydrogenase subunit E2 [Kineobactrum salinum]
MEAAPMGRIQNYVARAMEKSWTTIPHVTTHDEADITDFEHARQDYNAGGHRSKLTLLAPW